MTPTVFSADAVARAGHKPVLATDAAFLVLAVVAAILFGGCGESADEPGQTIHFVFPAGTAKLLEKGLPAPGVPELVTGRVGDTLVIRNRDRVTQFMAGYAISPGQKLKIPLRRPGSYITDCSAHKDRSIRMEISE